MRSSHDGTSCAIDHDFSLSVSTAPRRARSTNGNADRSAVPGGTVLRTATACGAHERWAASASAISVTAREMYVRSVDPFWHTKYAEGPDGRLAPVVAGGSAGHDEAPHDEDGEHGHGHAIHMPSPSYFPLLAALGLPIRLVTTFFNTQTGRIAIDG